MTDGFNKHKGNHLVNNLVESSIVDDLESSKLVNQPCVSVVIVHYQGVNTLSKCLESLFSASYSNFDVVLVDNGSKDGSVDFVKTVYGDSLRVVHSKSNLGFVGGNNLALGCVDCDYVVLLNDDTVVTPDWLEHLVDVADCDSSIGVCQPKLLSLSNPEFFEYNGCAGGMMDVYGVPFCKGRIFDVVEKDIGQYDRLDEVFWAGGAAIMLKSSALSEVGFLDPLFYAHMEEIDLCWRLRLAGYRVVSVPNSVVYHLGGGTPIAEKFYLKQRNNLIMMLKNYSGSSLIKYFPGRMVLDAMSFAFFVVKGEKTRAKAVLKAYLSLIRISKKILQTRHQAQKTRKINDKTIINLMHKKSIAIQHYLLKKTKYNQLLSS